MSKDRCPASRSKRPPQVWMGHNAESSEASARQESQAHALPPTPPNSLQAGHGHPSSDEETEARPGQ